MWAVMPLKDLDRAKQRLASVLDPAQRRELLVAMAQDVLEVLKSVTGLEDILVVCHGREAQTLAERWGARVLREPGNRGQSAAIAAACHELERRSVKAMLTVPADVPLISAAEIHELMKAHGSTPAVTIVPAHDRRGTNCMVCSPPNVMDFHFGKDSFVRHVQEAESRGIKERVLNFAGLGLDIDEPADLWELVRRCRSGRTHEYLHASGIADRCGDGRGAAAPVRAMGSS